MKHKELLIVFSFTVAVTATLAWFGLTNYFAIREKELNATFVQVCGQNAQRTYKEGTKESIEVEKTFYKNCLDDFGYKNTIE